MNSFVCKMMVTSVWICVMLVLHSNHAMRCRSGNSELIHDVEKAMMKCRQNNSESGKTKTDLSRIEESSEDDSSSLADSDSLFSQDFFSHARNGIKNISNNYGNQSSSRGINPVDNSYGQQLPMQFPYMIPSNNTNMKEYQNQMFNNYDGGFMMDGMPQYDIQGTTDTDFSGKSCIFQCFFEELKSVDQRGFPERISMTRMLLRGIQDPTLRDFIGQSILQCFQFLNSGTNHDKCAFSHSLMNCFADKGQEQCEDWYE